MSKTKTPKTYLRITTYPLFAKPEPPDVWLIFDGGSLWGQLSDKDAELLAETLGIPLVRDESTFTGLASPTLKPPGWKQPPADLFSDGS